MDPILHAALAAKYSVSAIMGGRRARLVVAAGDDPYVTHDRADAERVLAQVKSLAPAYTDPRLEIGAETEPSAAFTDGPWQSQHDFDIDGEATIIGAIDGPDDGQFHYTTVCELNTDAPEWRANKRLILAAEGMLAALMGLDRGILGTAESNASGNPEWEYVSARVNAARAAIAKAAA